MKRFQTLITGISAVALVAAFAAPSLAGKAVIEDEELDEVTAAGQPKIAQTSTKNGSATSFNFQVNVFASHLGGQTDLTALTLNNVMGENQVANAMNIQSGSTFDDASGSTAGSQDNSITQTWGSAKAWKAVAGKGKEGKDGEVECAAGIIAKCVAQNGGDATPGSVALLWEFADEISDASTKDGDAYANNTVITIVAGSFDIEAQTSLTAITVNNVLGFNQVANGTNIAGGEYAGGNIAGNSGSATNQSNFSEQWRGASKGYTQVGSFFTAGQ